MGTHKPGESLGEIGEYFDVKEERQDPIDDNAGRDLQDDAEGLPLRTTSSDDHCTPESCGRARRSFTTANFLPPLPLHFKHLNSPNPAHALNSSHNFDKSRGRRRSSCLVTRFFCCCCCSLCSVLLTASILLGFTALVTWLILRPVHRPRYSLDNVEVRNLTVTAQDSSVNSDLVFTISAENLNRKLGLKFDGVGIETLYRGQAFGRSFVGSFALGHKHHIRLTSELVLKDFLFVPASLGRELSADAKLARVELRIRMRAKVRVKLGVFTSFAVKVFVDCDVAVKPPRRNSPSSVMDKTCKRTR